VFSKTIYISKWEEGSPEIFGAIALFTFRREISELPRPIAVKLCHVIGNRRNFKRWFANLSIPGKMWGNKNLKIGAKFLTRRVGP